MNRYVFVQPTIEIDRSVRVGEKWISKDNTKRADNIVIVRLETDPHTGRVGEWLCDIKNTGEGYSPGYVTTKDILTEYTRSR